MRKTLVVFLAVMSCFAAIGCVAKQSVQPDQELRDVIFLNDDGSVYDSSVEKVVEEEIPQTETPAPAEISVLQETKTQIDKINEKVERIVNENGYSDEDIGVVDTKQFIAEVQKPLLTWLNGLEGRTARLEEENKTFKINSGKIVGRLADVEDKVSFHHPETEVSGTGDVNIAGGKIALDKSAKNTLRSLAKKAKSGEVEILEIIGHADNTKPKSANITNYTFSLQRAETTRDFFKEEGVNVSAIKITGAGSTERYGEKANNRRITIITKKIK